MSFHFKTPCAPSFYDSEAFHTFAADIESRLPSQYLAEAETALRAAALRGDPQYRDWAFPEPGTTTSFHHKRIVLAVALAAAPYGLRSFPTHSKDDRGRSTIRGPEHRIPRVFNWPEDATANPATIKSRAGGVGRQPADPKRGEKWGRVYPPAHAAVGLGWAMGAGFFGLDVDGADGEETLARLESELGPLPETVMQLSGRPGGRHLIFATAPDLILPNSVGDAGGLGRKLDGRGHRGFLHGCGTVHPSGRFYTFASGHAPREIDFALLPEAWQERILSLAEKRKTGTRSGKRRSTATAETASTAMAGGRDRPVGLDGWLDAIGDHPETEEREAGLGFYKPLNSCACAFWKADPEGDPEELFGLLTGAVERATVAPDRVNLDRYFDPDYLWEVIESARAFILREDLGDESGGSPPEAPTEPPAGDAAQEPQEPAQGAGNNRDGAEDGEVPEALPAPAAGAGEAAQEPGGDREDLAAQESQEGAVAAVLRTAMRQAADNGAPFSDTWAGARHADLWRGKRRYVSATGQWLAWTGQRWAAQTAEDTGADAKATSAVLYNEAQRACGAKPSTGNQTRLRKAAALHGSAAALARMVESSRSEPGMHVASPAEFDRDPYALTARNGIVDLRTGVLRPARPEDLVSKLAGVTYDPEARAPMWEAFLETILPDPEVRAFVQRAAGYTLTGAVGEEKFFLLYGTGANGKSVFANTLAAVMGEYARQFGAALVTKNKNDNEASRMVAALPGVRLAQVDETNPGDVFDSGRMKSLASREPLSARRLYAEAFQFQPTHHLWIRTQFRPGSLDASDGFWRRCIPIPFTVQIAEAKRVTDLDARLVREELPGVLAWAVKGAMDWAKNGLKVPAIIQTETTQYREETDLLGQWLADRTIRDPNGKMTTKEAFADYKEFCEELGIGPGTAIVLGRALVARGIAKTPDTSKRGFAGIRLRVLADGAG